MTIYVLFHREVSAKFEGTLGTAQGPGSAGVDTLSGQAVKGHRSHFPGLNCSTAMVFSKFLGQKSFCYFSGCSVC